MITQPSKLMERPGKLFKYGPRMVLNNKVEDWQGWGLVSLGKQRVDGSLWVEIFLTRMLHWSSYWGQWWSQWWSWSVITCNDPVTWAGHTPGYPHGVHWPVCVNTALVLAHHCHNNVAHWESPPPLQTACHDTSPFLTILSVSTNQTNESQLSG